MSEELYQSVGWYGQGTFNRFQASRWLHGFNLRMIIDPQSITRDAQSSAILRQTENLIESALPRAVSSGV